MSLDDQERISDVERDVAVIESELSAIKGALLRLEAKLDAYQSNYVPRNEIAEMFRSRDEQIRELREAQKDAKSSWRQWISIFIAAAAFLYAVWPNK